MAHHDVVYVAVEIGRKAKGDERCELMQCWCWCLPGVCNFQWQWQCGKIWAMLGGGVVAGIDGIWPSSFWQNQEYCRMDWMSVVG